MKEKIKTTIFTQLLDFGNKFVDLEKILSNFSVSLA